MADTLEEGALMYHSADPPGKLTDAYIEVDPSAEQIVDTTIASVRRVRDFGRTDPFGQRRADDRADPVRYCTLGAHRDAFVERQGNLQHERTGGRGRLAQSEPRITN